MEGTGKVLVIAVGVFSQTGIIYSLLGAADKNADKKEEKVYSENNELDNAKVRGKDSSDEEQQSVLQKKLGPLWSIPEWNVAAILGAQGMVVPFPAPLCRLDLVGHVHVIADIYSCVEFRP